MSHNLRESRNHIRHRRRPVTKEPKGRDDIDGMNQLCPRRTCQALDVFEDEDGQVLFRLTTFDVPTTAETSGRRMC